MPLFDMTLALLALLLTPGPTNTMIFLSGTDRGFAPTLRLLPAEWAAYLLVAVPLSHLGAQLYTSVEWARPVIAAAASAWVLYLALRLWGHAADNDLGPEVTPARIFVTTLLNPKAGFAGLVLLPAAEGMMLRVVVFSGLIAFAAAVWALAGAALPRRGEMAADWLFPLIRRLAAVWLAIISFTLVSSVFA